MDVSVETTGNLGRRLKFTVLAGEVEKRVADRLRRMKKTVRLDGFRPGKVPEKVLEERFGERVFHEVASEIIESSYQQAVTERGLIPAGQPDFKDANILRGRDIQFTADIELYPEFEPASLTKAKVEKPLAEVRDSDVDDMVERLRLRHAEWRAVQRPVQDGDRVRVHLEEQAELFNTDDNGDLLLSVGAAGVAGDFAAQLLRAGCGDTKKIKLKFPKDYPQTELAGKKVKLRVEVRAVEESILPPLGQDFFERCGVKEGGLEALKKMLKEGMEHELKGRLEKNFKDNVLDVLLEKNKIDVPRVMVQREIDRMRNEVAARFSIKEKADAPADDLFREPATRRVKLGLIMNKIAERDRLDVSEQEFEARLDRMTGAYEDADAVRQHYRSNRQARAGLIGLVLEDKVFQRLLEQLQIEEKPCNFKDVMDSESTHGGT